MANDRFEKRRYILLITIALIIMCLVGVCLCITYINQLHKELDSETSNFLSEINLRACIKIEDSFKNTISQLVCFSNVISHSNDISLKDLETLIHQGETNYTSFYKLYKVDLDGKCYMSDGSIVDLSLSDSFKIASNGKTYISNVYYDKGLNEVLIDFSVPVFLNGQIVSVLIGSHNLDTIQSLFAKESFNKNGYSIIINSNGDYLFETKTKTVEFGSGNFFNKINQLFPDDRDRVAKIIGIMQRRDSGMESYDIKQERFFISYRAIDVNNWYLITIFPSDVFSSHSARVLQLSVIGCGVVISLLIFSLCIIAYVQATNRRMLKKLAYSDNVTGGGNINWFIEYGHKRIVVKPSGYYALCVLDIEKFKVFNDTYGHESGDKMLAYVYDTITTILTPEECVSRIMSDTYCILFKYTTVEKIRTKIEDLVNKINTLNDELAQKYLLSFSCGVYQIEDPNILFLDAYDRAILALQNGKKIIGSIAKVNFYRDDDRKNMIREKKIENRMESALKNGEFLVYYQPKYNVKTGHIAGAEALVRWKDPVEGLLPPIDFVPLFERNGFILEVDIFVFEQVCIMLSEWQQMGITPFVISVNMSRAYIDNSTFLDVYYDLITKYKIDPSLIELELTETAVYDNMEKLLLLIEDIHRMGFSCSLDDFGTGYSSLNMLKDVPVDVLKIDKGFFIQKDSDSGVNRASEVVKTVIDLANKLKIKTVSEGIETDEQVEFLRNAKCDMIQGYIFSKPLPRDEFEKLVRSDEEAKQAEQIN